jgi:hypothetical protein
MYGNTKSSYSYSIIKALAQNEKLKFSATLKAKKVMYSAHVYLVVWVILCIGLFNRYIGEDEEELSMFMILYIGIAAWWYHGKTKSMRC